MTLQTNETKRIETKKQKKEKRNAVLMLAQPKTKTKISARETKSRRNEHVESLKRIKINKFSSVLF